MTLLPARSARALILLMALATHSASAQPVPRVHVISGTGPGGVPTELWQRMLRGRVTPSEMDSIVALRRNRTAAEDDWARLIESRRAGWDREIPALAAPFSPAPPPGVALVVLGNVGGSDAFAADSAMIGFDLSELQGAYGSASAASSADLIDRLFRHEYTHLMQKAWLRQHPWQADTPLQSALMDIWLEGQGNYYSLSERWRSSSAGRPPAAQQALSTLEPRFVARLAALACAGADHVPSIRKGLSAGPFDQKWGALPVALWLEEERGASDHALRDLIEAGPDGVWDLAARHLAPPLAAALNEVRAVGSTCHKPQD